MVGGAILAAVVRLAVVLAIAAPPSASPHEVEGGDAVVRWHAPESCPSEADVVASAEQLLGTPLRADATTLRIDARVERVGDGNWRLDLRESSASGERTRTLHASSCDALANATAVLVSVGAGAREQTTVPTSARQTAPPAPAPHDAATPARSRAPARWWGSTRVTTGAAVQPLPSVAPGLAAALGARTRFVRIELAFAWWFARRTMLDDGSGRGGALRLWWMGPRACGVPAVGRVELPVCGAVQLGAMRGIGLGVDRPEAARVPWVALAAGPGLEVRIVPVLAFVLDVDLVVPLVRGTFALDGLGAVHRTGPVAMTAMAGLGVRWP